jgi:GTP:adenosylcobinamide-phosphate guanylyltransferase
MNAIVTAGGVPQPDEPLYPLTQGKPKALLDIGGKLMIQWVLDALNDSQRVSSILVVGLAPTPSGRGLPGVEGLSSRLPLSLLEDHGGMIANIQAGAREIARRDPHARQMLVASSDIPAVTGEMVDWVVGQIEALDADVCYNVIRRSVMEKRYPGSKRTYLKLRDAEVCGGDLNGVGIQMALGANPIWNQIIASRKNPLKQASLIGFGTLFGVLFGLLSLRQAQERVSRRTNIRGIALECPYAELGMDVDKPFQLEIMRQDLLRQAV